MISLIEATEGPSFQSVADALLSRVLDCAEFYRWRQNTDGTRSMLFRLVKALPGIPKGTVLSLAALHERLAMEATR